MFEKGGPLFPDNGSLFRNTSAMTGQNLDVALPGRVAEEQTFTESRFALLLPSGPALTGKGGHYRQVATA
jgi:hypothetical protein